MVGSPDLTLTMVVTGLVLLEFCLRTLAVIIRRVEVTGVFPRWVDNGPGGPNYWRDCLYRPVGDVTGGFFPTQMYSIIHLHARVSHNNVLQMF